MAAAHFHFALSEWSISCCCPDLVPSLGIDYGKQVNLFSSQSEDQRGHMKTWCRDCHTLPRDSGLWAPCHDWFGLSVFWAVGVGMGKKFSEFQPPTHLLSSPPTFPACLVSVPTVGRRLYRAQLEPCLNEADGSFPSVSPRAGQTPPNPIFTRSFPFTLLLISDIFQFSNTQFFIFRSLASQSVSH